MRTGKLLTPGEASALLGTTPKTLVRWSDAGHLPRLRTLGGHRRYAAADIERLVREQERTATAFSDDDEAPLPPKSAPGEHLTTVEGLGGLRHPDRWLARPVDGTELVTIEQWSTWDESAPIVARRIPSDEADPEPGDPRAGDGVPTAQMRGGSGPVTRSDSLP